MNGAGNQEFRAQVRFSAVAALAGRPEALESLANKLHHGASDGELKGALSALVTRGVDFRGGQPHGSLKKLEIVSAVAEFCFTPVETCRCCPRPLRLKCRVAVPQALFESFDHTRP